MFEDRLTLLLCRSSAATDPEGLAILNAGLMSRPADGRWMVAGVYDGMLVPDPEQRVRIRFQVLGQDGVEIPTSPVVEAQQGIDAGDTDQRSVYGRMLIQMPVPSLSDLAAGLYRLRVGVLGATQDIPFIVPMAAEGEPDPT